MRVLVPCAAPHTDRVDDEGRREELCLELMINLLFFPRVLLHGHGPVRGTEHPSSGDGGVQQLPGCPLPEEAVLPDRGLDGGLAGEVPLWRGRVRLPALLQQAGELVRRWTD